MNLHQEQQNYEEQRDTKQSIVLTQIVNKFCLQMIQIDPLLQHKQPINHLCNLLNKHAVVQQQDNPLIRIADNHQQCPLEHLEIGYQLVTNRKNRTYNIIKQGYIEHRQANILNSFPSLCLSSLSQSADHIKKCQICFCISELKEGCLVSVELVFHLSIKQQISTVQLEKQFGETKLSAMFDVNLNIGKVILKTKSPLKIQLAPQICKSLFLVEDEFFDDNSLEKMSFIAVLIGNKSVLELQRLWNKRLRNIFQTIVANFQQYRFQYEKALIKIVRIFQFRSFHKQSLYENILKGVSTLFSHLKQKLGLISIDRLYASYSNLVNPNNADQPAPSKFLKIFQSENGLQQLPNEINANYILANCQRSAKQRSEFLVPVKNQSRNQRLEISLSKALSALSDICHSVPEGSIVLDFLAEIDFTYKYNIILENKDIYLQSLKYWERTILDYSCLGCVPYFHKNRNLFDPGIHRSPVIFFSKMKNIKEKNQDFLACIVALLNSGGGIFLCDIQKFERSFFPIGQTIGEADKSRLKQLIEKSLSQIKCLQSQHSVKQLLRIDFVPIMDSLDWQKPGFHEPSRIPSQEYFIEGLYVLRIRVCPRDSSLLYYYQDNDELMVYLQQTNKKKLIKGKEIVRFIKRKVRVHHVCDHLFQEYRILSNKAQNCFDHDCKNPAIGQPLQQPRPEPQEQLIQKQKEYKSMCLFVARERHLSVLSDNLKQFGVKFQIQTLFNKYRFNSAKYTGILYHDLDYYQLFGRVSKNKDFFFEGKPLLIVKVTRYLKVKKHQQMIQAAKTRMSNWSQWLKKQFPHDRLYVYEAKQGKYSFQEEEEVYYIKAQTKTSSLFLYYLLNNYLQKALFKEPERPQKLKLIYSSSLQQ